MSTTVTATETSAPVTSDATPSPSPIPTTPTSSNAYDWKSVGVDDAGLNMIMDRQWKNPADLLKSYANLEKLTGVPADQIIKLPKTNDQAAWNEVYSKLGRPESADKYAIPVPEGQTAEFAKQAAEWFYEAGMPQSAVTKLAEKWNGFMADQQKMTMEKQAQEFQIQVNDLKKTWGHEFDQRAAVVDRAAESFGINEQQLSSLKSALGPKGAMELLYNIGSKIALESTQTPAGMNQRGEFTLSPDQAKARIMQLKSDRTFAQLFTSADPKQRMDARTEMDRLHQLAYPGTTDYTASNARS